MMFVQSTLASEASVAPDSSSAVTYLAETGLHYTRAVAETGQCSSVAVDPTKTETDPVSNRIPEDKSAGASEDLVTTLSSPSPVEEVTATVVAERCFNGKWTKTEDGDSTETTCVCNRGWKGKECHLCDGRVRLTDPTGLISDGVGNYSVNQQCAWLIDGFAAQRASSSQNSSTADTIDRGPAPTIRLRFEHFATECSWDHLYVFDGDGIHGSPLIGAFSGIIVSDEEEQETVFDNMTLPSSSSNSVTSITPRFQPSLLQKPTPEFTAKSGFVFLFFYSDAAYNLTGFNISYAVNECPMGDTGTPCSGNGVCLDGVCTCDGGFTGAACDRLVCPRNCSGRGTCDREAHRCRCQEGFAGPDCSQASSDGYWDVVPVSNQKRAFQPSPRASHAAAVYRDQLWIIVRCLEVNWKEQGCGIGLQLLRLRLRSPGRKEALSYGKMRKEGSPDSEALTGGEDFMEDSLQFIVSFDLTGRVWITIHSEGDKRPSWRFGHSAVIHGDKIYIYGGTLAREGEVVNELWTFDITSHFWEPVRVVEGECNDLLCGPLASTGHAAVDIGGQMMLILFGHSPKYGYLSYVQEYDFGTAEWRIVRTHGARVQGGFGVAATWDPVSQMVYAQGGAFSQSTSSYVITDAMYAYDPDTRIWSLLTPSGSPRYLHSMVAIDGAILMFGGNPHNDTSTSQGARCFSSELFVYEPGCDSWHRIPFPRQAERDWWGESPERFGHSASVFDGAMYIFGGYNGRMLNSLIRFTPGDCGPRQTEAECVIKQPPGRLCRWEGSKCEPPK
ncbi:unnamed protein product, partial [Cyprideis torosa]